MTYVASVIASNPANYWRLNEGPGATATLDYGLFPGMLWPAWVTNGAFPIPGRSGFGFGGITSDGGAMDVGGFGVWNLTTSAAGSVNPYTPLPEPGTLEFWYFDDSSSAGGFVGWVVPGTTGATGGWGFSFTHNLLSMATLQPTPIVQAVAPSSQWHHVASSWTSGNGFIYLDGVLAQAFAYPSPIGGSHVNFCIGLAGTAGGGLNNGGLVSEAATYRRDLSVAELAGHRAQAELAGQRPHWIGQRFTSSSSSSPPLATYTTGVTHVGITGTGQLSLPTGLRGLKIDITTGPTGTRVLPGVPPYIFDVGWLSVLDPSGMLAEIRPNRDTRTWLPDNMGLATSFGWALNPGVVMNVTELDPA